MHHLNLIQQNGQFLADSREVAEMIEVRHADLLEKIDGFIRHLENGNFRSQDFFIEGTYTTPGNNKVYKCYLITRKGCDMVANKTTGEKGVLFTAAYVTKFEEMDHVLKTPVDSYMIQDPVARAQRWIEEEKQRQQLQTEKLILEQRVAEFEPKVTYLDQILQSKDTVTITQIAKDYGLTGQVLNKILHEGKVQFKQNGQWLLYRQYQDLGYTKSITVDIIHNDGHQSVKMNTKWTQKGRLFIHDLLNKRGIIAFIDRKDISKVAK